MNICISSDENYATHLGVLITSIILNNKSCHINFYILDGGISEDNKKKLQSLNNNNVNIIIVNINNKLFEVLPKSSERPDIPVVTYYKFIIPSLFANVDKMLFLDTDMIVVDNINELYYTNIDNYYFAAVQDLTGFAEQKRLNLTKGLYYFNCDLLLMNLTKLRKDHIEKQLFEYTIQNRKNILYLDQDTINAVCEDKVKYLDLKWNLQNIGDFFKTDFNELEFKKAINSPKIIHFLGVDKPWKKNSKIPQKELYYKYLNMSLWK